VSAEPGQHAPTNKETRSDSDTEEQTKLMGGGREFNLANRTRYMIPMDEEALGTFSSDPRWIWIHWGSESASRTTGSAGLTTLPPMSNGASSSEGHRSRFIDPPPPSYVVRPVMPG
jgi:hypothetical protein